MSQQHRHAHQGEKVSFTSGLRNRVQQVVRTPEGGFAKAPLIIALNVFILMTVAGGATAYAAYSHSVKLTVDGRTETVRTFASTVDEVLDSRDISVRKADKVNLDADAPLADGVDITVQYAKPVTVTIDGVATTETAYDATVGDLMKRHGIEPSSDAFVSDDADTRIPRSGINLVVSSVKAVTVVADGASRTLFTAAPTAADVLKEAKIDVDADDEIVQGADTVVAPLSTVQVVRIQKESRTEEVDVPFETQSSDDPEATKGETTVVTPGAVGRAREDVDLVIADGVVRDRIVTKREVLSAPVAQVQKVGTKAPAANFAAGDTVWDALAKCESGGNWAINTGNGYYGGVQFSLATWRSLGGTGLPSEASREEQIQRASALQARAGWGQWPGCARKLGLL